MKWRERNESNEISEREETQPRENEMTSLKCNVKINAMKKAVWLLFFSNPEAWRRSINPVYSVSMS